MTQLQWLLLYKELQTRKFKGNLDLYKRKIPSWFRIPNNLKILGRIDLSETNISKLPKNLQCKNLDLYGCNNIKELPEGLNAENMISLSNSYIEKLPKNLRCQSLYLDNCKNIKELPEGLQVINLDIRGSGLTHKYCVQMKQERKIFYNMLF